jgi:hypothetical protein
LASKKTINIMHISIKQNNNYSQANKNNNKKINSH